MPDRALIKTGAQNQTASPIEKQLETLLFVFYCLRDDTHMTSMKVAQFLNLPNPLVNLSPKFFRPFDPGGSITPPPPSPNDKQPIKRKHNPKVTFICYQVLPSGRLSFSVKTH